MVAAAEVEGALFGRGLAPDRAAAVDEDVAGVSVVLSASRGEAGGWGSQFEANVVSFGWGVGESGRHRSHAVQRDGHRGLLHTTRLLPHLTTPWVKQGCRGGNKVKLKLCKDENINMATFG